MGKCVNELQTKLKEYGLKEEETAAFLADAKKMFREAMAGAKGADMEKAVLLAAEKRVMQGELAALGKKRATQLQLAKRFSAIKFCLESFQGMEAEGLAAMLVGSKFNRDGARLSVDAVRTSLEGVYRGGFMADLRDLGKLHVELYRKGKLDREIAEALWSMGKGREAYKGPKEAMEIAQVLHKWSERARTDENRAGAWIAALPGYIVRQSHDQARIRRAGPEKWKDFVRQRLDWDKTADGAFNPVLDKDAAEKFLDGVYAGLATGNHLKMPERDLSPLSKPGVVGSVAARASKERVLHFKSGGDWYDYNAMFGTQNLREAFESGLRYAARNTGLMRVFGPAPAANLQNVLEALKAVLQKRGDLDGVIRLSNSKRMLEAYMRNLDGSMDADGNPNLARRMAYVRNGISMAKLGGAVISSWSDMATFGAEFAYQGRGFFMPILKGLGEAIRGRGSDEQRGILSCCGVFYESMSGAVASRFSGNDMPGKMSAAMNLFFRLNLLSWWTDCWKKAACLMMAHDLALVKDKSWTALSAQRQRTLGLYGIDGDIWEMLRKGRTVGADGRDYLTPEIVGDIGADEIKAYMQKKGMLWSKARGESFREDMANRLRAYFRDRVGYAVLEPDAKSSTQLYFGWGKGTVLGEALRCIMQFKSFPLVFAQRVLQREIYGRSEGGRSFWGNLGKGLANNFKGGPEGGEGSFAKLILAMTALGYASMSAKQLIAGKTPRELFNKKTWWATVRAAFLQGGGLGIYGDFLFGEKSRMGNSLYSTALGPTASSIADIYSLYQDIRDGNAKRSTAANAIRTAYNLVPGNNLFWLRAGMDHLIMNDLFESMNPGYLRRMQARIRRENGQTFWWKP